MLKYTNADITFQEFPNEVALCINISNCPCHCEGCHSSFLVMDIGNELTEDVIQNFINRYKGDITLIGFMGGDASPNDIIQLAKYIKHNSNIKVGWYSGKETLPLQKFPLHYFDYIKLGPFIKNKGGLKSKNTNQRFYSIINGKMFNHTNKFQNTKI